MYSEILATAIYMINSYIKLDVKYVFRRLCSLNSGTVICIIHLNSVLLFSFGHGQNCLVNIWKCSPESKSVLVLPVAVVLV